MWNVSKQLPLPCTGLASFWEWGRDLKMRSQVTAIGSWLRVMFQLPISFWTLDPRLFQPGMVAMATLHILTPQFEDPYPCISSVFFPVLHLCPQSFFFFLYSLPWYLWRRYGSFCEAVVWLERVALLLHRMGHLLMDVITWYLKFTYSGFSEPGPWFNVKTVFTWYRNFQYEYKMVVMSSEPCLNVKTVFPRYGDSHVKDKTVARPSYL